MSRRPIVEGLYDLIVDIADREQLDALDVASWVVDRRSPEAGGLPHALAVQLLPRLIAAFEAIKGEDDDRRDAQVRLANAILDVLRQGSPDSGLDERDAFDEPASRLLAVTPPNPTLGKADSPIRPLIPLNSSDLLVNGHKQPRIGSEIQRELPSADRVDLLCAFLRYSGVRHILPGLEAFVARRPGTFRVITTSYMAATERRAIEALRDLGAEVRVSYNRSTTRLHAKAWLFDRASGFSTGYIGSSNLSHSALHDGLEWNVRVSAIDNLSIINKFQASFEQYWNDPEFEDYDADAFLAATKAAKKAQTASLLGAIRVHPYPHQREILEELAAERVAGHHRNLIVAATGTGKTVIAALDYKRLVQEHGKLSLLFVAHRKEILDQSRSTFRAAMRDGSFGELLVGGEEPDEGQHVFASVQSLHGGRLEGLSPTAYDVVIVDEFHHAEAPTYVRLLEHLQPRYLVGLTATPERADGLDVKHWFDGRIASEIRLWEALDRGLLCPFQYFGVADDTDLSSVTFTRGRYDVGELERVFTGDHFRAKRILQAVERYVTDPTVMRALGFCVSIRHAELMAAAFTAGGLPSLAVSSKTKRDDRRAALQALRDGKVTCLFAVDLFNEGVDLPDVDTVLFLRPTESATVFLQQLGRGLRQADDKSCLTVLDFIGHAHKRFRFDVRYRALVGGTRRSVLEAVEEGFPYLPPGCSILLERQAQAHVVDNIRSMLRQGLASLAEDLRDVAAAIGEDVTLDRFLTEARLDVSDVYSTSGRSWSVLRRKAGLPWPSPVEGESRFTRAIARIQHVDDLTRIDTWCEWLRAEHPPITAGPRTPEGRLQLMLAATLGDRRLRVAELPGALSDLWTHDAVRLELTELLEAKRERLRHLTPALGLTSGALTPLRVHGTYAMTEIMGGLGVIRKERLLSPQAGVFFDEGSGADLFFITLQKSEKEYSPQTLYRDYPISERLFHWESQHITRADSNTGRRYIDHEALGTDVVLFVRHVKKESSLTQPYVCLGPARYVRHQNERPMEVVWRLDHPMPGRFYEEAKLAAG